MDAKVRFDQSAVCDRCGAFGAYLFDGEKFCADCYASRCSCCPEFGADDLATEAMDSDRHPGLDPRAGQ